MIQISMEEYKTQLEAEVQKLSQLMMELDHLNELQMAGKLPENEELRIWQEFGTRWNDALTPYVQSADLLCDSCSHHACESGGESK